MAEPVLSVAAIDAGYPGKQILFGVSFAVTAGEVVCLLGTNGSGKSTVLAAISGFVRPWRGAIRFAGENIGGRKPHAIFRARHRAWCRRRATCSATCRSRIICGSVPRGAARRPGRPRSTRASTCSRGWPSAAPSGCG